LILNEYWTVVTSDLRLPTKPSPLYEWLGRQPRSVVIELPLPRPDNLPGKEAQYLYTSVFHWQPLLNGYSGYTPTSHLRLLVAMEQFPDPHSYDYLHTVGAKFLIIHPGLLSADEYHRLRDAVSQSQDLTLVGSFINDLELARVYALSAAPPASPRLTRSE